MEKIGKDCIGLIFEKMTPTDWICSSIVCKSWWNVMRKWLKMRKTQFLICLKNEINLFGLNISEEKDRFCINPMYYLQSSGTGCLGQVSNYICARHKILSLYNKEICQKCLKYPSSSLCFDYRCNGLKCRDYMYVLQNGIAVKVRSYQCRYENCDKPTDSNDGYCYNHAILSSHKKEDVNIPKYNCTAITQSGKKCTIKTISRSSKCHHHVFSPITLI